MIGAVYIHNYSWVMELTRIEDGENERGQHEREIGISQQNICQMGQVSKAIAISVSSTKKIP